MHYSIPTVTLEVVYNVPSLIVKHIFNFLCNDDKRCMLYLRVSCIFDLTPLWMESLERWAPTDTLARVFFEIFGTRVLRSIYDESGRPTAIVPLST